MSVAFVLSGGASLGAIQVGMLRALIQRDIRPDLIVATSVGAVNGAILASAAIPGVLPPVDWDGSLLVDGGVVNNTPISHALALGARQIYVLPTGGPCVLSTPPHGALAMLVHATELMVAQRFAAELASLESGVEVVVLPPPCPIDVPSTDFGHARSLITRAEANAQAFLEGRAGSVVSLHGGRRRHRTRSGIRAELSPGS